LKFWAFRYWIRYLYNVYFRDTRANIFAPRAILTC